MHNLQAISPFVTLLFTLFPFFFRFCKTLFSLTHIVFDGTIITKANIMGLLSFLAGIGDFCVLSLELDLKLECFFNSFSCIRKYGFAPKIF